MYSKQPVLLSEQPITLTEDSSGNTAECIYTAVAVHPKLLLTIACVYRPPNANTSYFRQAMSNLLTEMSNIQCNDITVQHHNVILGDFNLDWSDQSTRSTMSQIFPGYTQLVQESTTDNDSIIDHIYTTLPIELIQWYTGESYFTDHKPIILTLQLHD
jgi:exonuclease III